MKPGCLSVLSLGLIIALLSALALRGIAQTTQPTISAEVAGAFASISEIIGLEGKLTGNVLTLILPRRDLDGKLFNDMGDIPIAAGIETRLDFYPCPCGKMDLLGQYVVTEEESNDVIDALRRTDAIKVVAISPMMMGEKPKLLCIRIQGAGQAESLASHLRIALNQTGSTNSPTTQP